MTTQQIIVGTVVYAVVLAVIVYFTRPTGRRFVGAVAVAAIGLWGIVPLGWAQGWWHVPLEPSPG